MKIGLDVRFWNESGVGRYIRNLVSGLEKIDKKNSYVLFANDENHIEIKNKNWKVVNTNIHWHSIEEQLLFSDVLSKEKLDLMHFTYFSLPVRYQKPFIVTIHDLILHHFATGEATTRTPIIYNIKLLAYKYIINQAAKKSRKIITVSNATKKNIEKDLNISGKKIEVTYEGIEDNIKVSENKSRIIEDNYFLHVGNLYPHKNMNLVLTALRKIKEFDKLSIKLIIIGKEDFFNKRYQMLAKEFGLENEIIFKGKVSDSDLSNYYQNARALISSSLMEGFDLPTVEAMANNCLVLASDIPVHREICQESAIYFNPTDEKELILQLKNIFLNNKNKYKKNIDQGRSRASEFSWSQMAKKTLEIYENSVSL